MACSATCRNCRSACGDEPAIKPGDPGFAEAAYHYQPQDRSALFADLSPESSRDICVHEAGHAVTWLAFGGELGRAGVDVRSRFSCMTFTTMAKDRYRANQITSFAGPVAECRAHGLPYVSGSTYGFALDAAYAGDKLPCDVCTIMRQIAEHRREKGQRLTDRDFRREYHFWREQTEDLMDRPDVWQTINAVADALMIRGTLSDSDIRGLCPDSIFLDGDRRPVWVKFGFEAHPYEPVAA